MSVKYVVAASVVVLGISACAGPEQGEHGDGASGVPARLAPDGALQFASADDFFIGVDAISHRTPAQLDAWERSLGFLSMRRGFAELEAQLTSVPADQRTALLAANADLVDPASSTTEPARRVRAIVYAALVDRHGILYIGDVAHKVTATDILFARGGSRQTFDAWLAHKPDQLSASAGSGSVESISYIAPVPAAVAAASCTDAMSGTTSISDRRETYNAYPIIVIGVSPLGEYAYRYGFEWDLAAKKKNLFGSWVSYGTTFQTYSSTVEMDAFTVTDSSTPNYQYRYDRYHPSFPDQVLPDSNGSEAESVAFFFYIGDLVRRTSPISIPPMLTYTLHFETTTRGTFPTRGILDRAGCCGDGSCQPLLGETESNCAVDCTRCASGVCSVLENVNTCYADCHCGDGVCEPEESLFSCPMDCGDQPCDPNGLCQ